MNPFIPRLIENKVRAALDRGKSVLLLGARQTGKTTLIRQFIKPDISYSFATAHSRQRYESNVSLLEAELIEQIKSLPESPIIFIDEVQKIPRVMDMVQNIIDNKLAKFILTGSSARKLKLGHEINLLPGRVVSLMMTPLLYKEIQTPKPFLEEILLYGTLPGIITELNKENRETDLYSYVTTYLEEEIRAEAVVRNVGSFTRFLEVAAGEAGKTVNFSRISQDIGVADTTIGSYYQILEDCLITHRIDPITDSQTKRRLIKSPKYLFFDLGIRRACANEGTRLPQQFLGNLFEHFVGNELLYLSQLKSPQIKLRYWRDVSGPEIDYVIDYAHQYIPIEVKWTDKPTKSDAKHLIKFMTEHSLPEGYIICRTPQRYKIEDKIIVIPWQEMSEIFTSL
jgi:predicted AAA+ superfamily ATPase